MALPVRDDEIEDIEIDLLLEAVFRRYGYDYRNYARASARRRIVHLLKKTGQKTVSEMIPRLLYDREFFADILSAFSITVTEMFRDPGFYRALREEVIPYLKTYPFIKVWHAGCATGEEVYSLAIFLKEEGFYDRSTIFATDINDAALARAKEGIYSLENMKQNSLNYQKAGGGASFSDYYQAHYDSIIMNQSLKKHITFANHNLVTDSSFGEMHLVFCRNVLIYFDRTLQNRVLRLFDDSLIHGGFLCLGTKETIQFSDVEAAFEQIDKRQTIYRKKTIPEAATRFGF
jgi:chemotaxis protein methyltransferase CheR